MKFFLKHSRLSVLLGLTVIVFGAARPAFADDPPARVGRLSYLEGTVSFHAADTGDWALATPNYPVTSGNSFWTDANGRDEIQMGAVDVRMDNMTELNVVELDDAATRLEVPQGTVNVHVRAVPTGGSVQVMTPDGPVSLVQPGTYHIDSGHPTGDQPSNQTLVSVFEGQLQINGQRSLLEVMPGETAVLNGNPPTFSLQEGNPTPFDDWALMLEKREATVQQSAYVSPYMTGAQDLGLYGQWQTVDNYGPVWYPASVDPEWAPYRYGQWAFVEPWGWTWVDQAPWGFAPFHYGRWAQFGGRWGWTPGRYAERPVYAPALVAFVGGGGWSVSLSGGALGPAVGWIPLGPHEAFHPYYRTSVNYARNVNVAHVDPAALRNMTAKDGKATITHYVNQRAATVVPAGSFTQGAPVHHAMVAVSAQELARAPVGSSIVHLAPTGTAARAGGRALPEQAHEDLPHETPAGMMRPATGATPAPVVRDNVISPAPRASAPDVRPAAVPYAETRPMAATSPVTVPVPAHRAPVPTWSAAPQHAHRAIERPAAAAPQLPRAEVVHPQQTTRITPSPQGWQRVPATHEEQPARRSPPPSENERRNP